MEHNRFINNNPAELQEINCSPIDGYEYFPVLTLEEAVGKITQPISRIMDQVATAKTECNRKSTLLTHDESAAIYLYTMPITFFSRLNEALRAEDRHALEPWFAFLKLFITALEKLPSHKGIVWRGVSKDVSSIFADGYGHIWWSVNSFSKDLKVIEQRLDKTSTVLTIDTNHGKDISAFSAFPDEQEVILMPGTCVIAKSAPLVYENRLFIVHLKEENSRSYIFELIKHEYQQHSRIECIMNPSKSFPIEQSYINLAIVETKEQQEKEKKLLNANHSNEIIGTYEEIYGAKTKIEIQNIFEKCKDQTEKILVLGRAGIGKTTFCRYVAYQWATGAIWQQYELVILIHLRNLTENHYPLLASGAKYSLIDLVKTEYFYDGLSEEYETLLKEELNKSQVLWLLDGYDEIIQNIPTYLRYLLDQLLNKPHHVLTSRPYSNTLSYNVQLEIIGFTDDNIEKYVQQFFDQIKDKIDNAPLQVEKLLNFLEYNPRVWGVVHIPVNLELICSLWCDTDWSETTMLTMTTVYDNIIEWLCRRHLTKQNISSSRMTKERVYTDLHKELAFLESLAFHGMESKSIILPPTLLRIASEESACSLQHDSDLLNMGILKSLEYKPIGTCIEANKNHYFLHLSFQEHFAARYLIKALNGIPYQKEKAIKFIKKNKYNQRFELVLTFASGLLIDCNEKQSINLFWATLLQEPLDLIGLRHQCIVISCLDEAECSKCIPQYRESMDTIIKWISYFLSEKHNRLDNHLLVTLKRCPSIVNQPEILDTLLKLLKDNDNSIKTTLFCFISYLPISNLYLPLFQLYIRALDDHDKYIKIAACHALWKMDKSAAANEVINRLVALLDDRNEWIRSSASKALGKMGEKAATNEVINRLIALVDDRSVEVRRIVFEALERIGAKTTTDKVVNRLLVLLDDANCDSRSSASGALVKMDEKPATSEVVNRLITLLDDRNDKVRKSACEGLGRMDAAAATDEVIIKLSVLLGDKNDWVRMSASEALGRMGEKAATNEVINRLLVLLDDANCDVRSSASEALGKMGTAAATDEVILRLSVLLGDKNGLTRRSASEALGEIGAKAITDKVVTRLFVLLDNAYYEVRGNACEALRKMGEKAATDEVIDKLVALLADVHVSVRRSAREALKRMGEKAVTNEVVKRLLILFGDTNDRTRIIACYAVAEVGEEAATTEVINRLATLLGDTNPRIRRNACVALRKMGGKAATNEVINKLLILIYDADDEVKGSACKALGKVSEKGVPFEVINRLLALPLNTNHRTIRNACETLAEVGEKAATNEVINRLISLLGDANHELRSSVCKALAKMGDKVATNEVVGEILDVYARNSSGNEIDEKSLMTSILNLSPCMSVLEAATVRKLVKYISGKKYGSTIEVSSEKIMRAFLDTKIKDWLPIILKIFVERGFAITATETTVTMHNSKEPVELTFSDREIGIELRQYFANWLDNSLQKGEDDSCE